MGDGIWQSTFCMRSKAANWCASSSFGSNRNTEGPTPDLLEAGSRHFRPQQSAMPIIWSMFLSSCISRILRAARRLLA